jgi:hypothetical protein
MLAAAVFAAKQTEWRVEAGDRLGQPARRRLPWRATCRVVLLLFVKGYGGFLETGSLKLAPLYVVLTSGITELPASS